MSQENEGPQGDFQPPQAGAEQDGFPPAPPAPGQDGFGPGQGQFPPAPHSSDPNGFPPAPSGFPPAPQSTDPHSFPPAPGFTQPANDQPGQTGPVFGAPAVGAPGYSDAGSGFGAPPAAGSQTNGFGAAAPAGGFGAAQTGAPQGAGQPGYGTPPAFGGTSGAQSYGAQPAYGSQQPYGTPYPGGVEPPRRSGVPAWLWIILGVGVLALIGGAILITMMLTGDKDDTNDPPVAQPTVTQPTAPDPAPSVPAVPDPVPSAPTVPDPDPTVPTIPTVPDPDPTTPADPTPGGENYVPSIPHEPGSELDDGDHAQMPGGKAPAGAIAIGEASGLKGEPTLTAAKGSSFEPFDDDGTTLDSDSTGCSVHTHGIAGGYDEDPVEATLFFLAEGDTQRYVVNGAGGKKYEFWGVGDPLADSGLKMYRIESDATLTSLRMFCYESSYNEAPTLSAEEILDQIVLN